MPTNQTPGRAAAASHAQRASAASQALPDDMLMPVIAGAYARGLADAIGLLGLPAIFLDQDGGVLFSNDSASTILGRRLAIRAGHLVSASQRDNAALSDLIAAVLHERDAGRRAIAATIGAGHADALTLHAIPVSRQGLGSGQLLGAILLLDSGTDPAAGAFLTRLRPAERAENSLPKSD